MICWTTWLPESVGSHAAKPCCAIRNLAACQVNVKHPAAAKHLAPDCEILYYLRSSISRLCRHFQSSKHDPLLCSPCSHADANLIQVAAPVIDLLRLQRSMLCAVEPGESSSGAGLPGEVCVGRLGPATKQPGIESGLVRQGKPWDIVETCQDH